MGRNIERWNQLKTFVTSFGKNNPQKFAKLLKKRGGEVPLKAPVSARVLTHVLPPIPISLPMGNGETVIFIFNKIV